MPINRPDRPLRPTEDEGAARGADHPDRAAHVQERAEGAHAEQVTPAEFDAGDRDAPTQSDVPAEAGPSAQGQLSDGTAADEVRGEPRSQRSRLRVASAVVITVLVVMAGIYLAMVLGVFAVE